MNYHVLFVHVLLPSCFVSKVTLIDVTKRCDADMIPSSLATEILP